MLWFSTSGRARSTVSRAASTPWKSGIRTSTRQSGASRRIAAIVRAKISAPPSARSSRLTLVTTTWARPISATVPPTRSGSPQSSHSGRPCDTAQNPQRRVHTSPRIMKVAVRSSQHSPMFGTAGLLAHGVELPLAHEGLEPHVVRAAGRTNLEPRRLAPLGFAQSVGLDDRERQRHSWEVPISSVIMPQGRRPAHPGNHAGLRSGAPSSPAGGKWCRRGDSNPHGLPHTPLKRARLPVPPLRRRAYDAEPPRALSRPTGSAVSARGGGG